MANSVDPDQTAPIGAFCSVSTLFASILNSSVFAADDFSRQLQQTTFSDAFFLGLLRVNEIMLKIWGVQTVIQQKSFPKYSLFTLLTHRLLPFLHQLN